MNKYSAVLFFCLSILGVQLAVADPNIIRYPRPSAKTDSHFDYINELLTEALSFSANKYQLLPSHAQMQQGRAVHEMKNGTREVDLLWSMSTDEREKSLIAIKIPIDKGLLGWRIPLVRSEQKNLFKDVKTLHDMHAYSAGQELDWPDVKVLESNGLTVATANSYEALFSMLEAGRFDYFPRSILEIWKEQELHTGKKLSVSPDIALHYPAAYYFFVAPNKRQFADDLNNGLEMMIRNGQFEKIFLKYHQTSIQKAGLKQRTVLELRNPFLNPANMPLSRSELWFKP
ncbi:substrate-binding periplasmic protein [Undibacterium sp. Ji49W]|uniref:substrate-binding periplasmic protein n=1 Tax=Undibacterium sp. Ji49W TaxID=3413040 RepID=UPI003BEF6C3A